MIKRRLEVVYFVLVQDIWMSAQHLSGHRTGGRGGSVDTVGVAQGASQNAALILLVQVRLNFERPSKRQVCEKKG